MTNTVVRRHHSYRRSSSLIWITSFIFLLVQFPGCRGWHDFTNVDYHCWPLSASAASPTALSSCTGVDIDWIEAPPAEIKAEEHFNVTYSLVLGNTFWDWAVQVGPQAEKVNFFAHLGIDNATLAKDWCENTVCPSDSGDVTMYTCCIHHVNVHSCPLDTSDYCGPWITPSGSTYTHSSVLWGEGSQTFWVSQVAGLYAEGTTQLIAHFKIANFQVVIYQNVVVKPRSECGNSICESEDGEDCSTCPADCGKCPFEMPPWALAIVIVVGVLIVAFLVGFGGYTKYRSEKLFWDESWLIPGEMVESAALNPGVFGSMISVATAGSDNMSQAAANRQIFTKTGLVNGRTVAIRDVPKQKFTLTKDIRKEVKLVRSLDHQNLNRFQGSCIELSNFCVVWEYCPKGAMSDVLLNQSIPINWAFRFSFCSDICRGMSCLHTNGIIHGRLKSNNCIVDDRWTVKITDYGVPSLRNREPADDDDDEDEMYKDQQATVYRAPETYDVNYVPAPAADLYAFGIILIEIATRDDPYGDEDRSMLPEKWRPDRPDLEAETGDNKCPCPKPYLDLMENCLDINPSSRPTFAQANSTVKRINPSKKSPVDLMMAMMEKYSKHLESIVAERTADLIVEKQKTDRLLYSMLPRAVADDLRQGRVIPAELYDQCTIYFSDIVGFTVISGKSKPIEVVGLLNKLYTAFDSIIELYDVYKVETIGDAYMVVSGVPLRNGNEHARQISLMSLDLVKICETFVIPHLPSTKLQIRVGLHSGGVCAGVVGLKMPRYCLFGDTVNTASRMESNGEAYKIHISNFTYEHLAKIGGFKIEERGVIPIKGKGDMRTWWLKDYTGPPAKLADLEDQKAKKTTKVAPPATAVEAGPLPVKNTLSGKNDNQFRKISSGNDSGFNEASGAGFSTSDTQPLAPID